jgi:hypothetical protein
MKYKDDILLENAYLLIKEEEQSVERVFTEYQNKLGELFLQNGPDAVYGLSDELINEPKWLKIAEKNDSTWGKYRLKDWLGWDVTGDLSKYARNTKSLLDKLNLLSQVHIIPKDLVKKAKESNAQAISDQRKREMDEYQKASGQARAYMTNPETGHTPYAGD